MLTKIWVDGFRSLNDFTFEPKQGLNVLVGANGAGKTNIIDFLKFVGQLEHLKLMEALNSIGGVPNAFTRFTNKERKPIKFSFEYSDWSNHTIEFGATIIFDQSKGLYFENQKISDWYDNERYFIDENKDEYSYYNFEKNLNIIQSKNEKEIFIPLSLEVYKYNFDPQKIKQFENYGLSSRMREDGEGLAHSIYSFSNPDEDESSLLQFIEPFENMVKHLRKDFLRLDVEKDDEQNLFKAYCYFLANEKEVKIPITHISDGMAKWLALSWAVVTAIESIYIEEPENFLHPELQRVFIKMLRERMEETGGIAIISTHSETILNNVKPEEVVMVTLEDGKTKANRVEDPEHLNNVIRETGFGMGYFYVSGGLE